MNKFLKSHSISLCLLAMVLFGLGLLHSISKKDNDLLFIISLYENKQYDLAKSQIFLYEKEFSDSDKMTTLLLIKANIEMNERNYFYADSLYDYLLNLNIEPSMQGEILINKATISYESSDFINSLSLLSKADEFVLDNNLNFQKELLKGKSNFGLLNYKQARVDFEKALTFKSGDPKVTLELFKTMLALNDEDSARALINKTIKSQITMAANSSLMNVWLDYLISEEEYSEIFELENSITKNNMEVDESTKLRFAKARYLHRDYENALRVIFSGTKYKNYRHYLEGLVYLDQGKVMKADSIFADVSRGFYYSEDILPDSNEEVVVLSWLERIKILYISYPAQALEEISKYLSNFPEDKQNPYVVYTYSSLLFKSEKYQEAINNLLYIKNRYDLPELQHNINAMLGDIWYNANLLDNAEQAYSNYLNLYPKGKHRSHANYNIALINFDQHKYDEAELQLQSILQMDSGPEMKEKAQYLLAEIYFYRSDYKTATELYEQIKQNNIPQITIDYRIAQSLYFLGKYREAATYIPKMITDPVYSFQILMLDGNINFNLKKYEDALDIYNEALLNSKTDEQSQEANSYIALTLYRLRRFEEASNIYIKLSQDKASPQAYFLMAAKASYHAKNYKQALLLFRQFVAEYPTSIYHNYAMANIGSIYYNQKEYNKAIETWIELLKSYETYQLFNEDEQAILSSVFTGLLWSLKQNPNQIKLDEINDMVDSFLSEYIKFELQYLLLKVYFGNEQWDDIIQLADNLREQFPQQENNEIRLYVAASLSGLDRYNEADSTYKKVFELEPNADVLTEWAKLDFQRGNNVEAISKLEQALIMDTSNQRFIALLQNLYDYNNEDFEAFWQKWSDKINPIPDQAYNLRMLWNYGNSNWQMAELLAKELLLNPNYQIRSMAQFIIGVSKYNLMEYDTAVIEFYRTIYLYPESTDLTLKSKVLIIKSYLLLDQVDQALNVFNDVKDALTEDEMSELSKLFNEKQSSHE